MLVTFHSKAYADITMFGEVAVSLLKMMGHSGTVPSAIQPEDIPRALERLKGALRRAEQASLPSSGDSDEPPISLPHRAMPLIKLLEASVAANCQVMWDN